MPPRASSQIEPGTNYRSKAKLIYWGVARKIQGASELSSRLMFLLRSRALATVLTSRTANRPYAKLTQAIGCITVLPHCINLTLLKFKIRDWRFSTDTVELACTL
jgi:hypothetical protein